MVCQFGLAQKSAIIRGIYNGNVGDVTGKRFSRLFSETFDPARSMAREWGFFAPKVCAMKGQLRNRIPKGDRNGRGHGKEVF